MTKRSAFTSGYLVRARAHGRIAALCRPLMTPPSIAEIRSAPPLSIVSIEDYEALVAPREAFVDFLVGPNRTGSRPRIRDAARPST